MYLYSFLFCGFICLLGQIIFDNTRLTSGHVTTLFVVLGALLDTFHIYDWLILRVGSGALVPITSFGHSLVHGALESTNEFGIMGLFLGMFNLTAPGIIAVIVFSFFLTLLFKPKS